MRISSHGFYLWASQCFRQTSTLIYLYCCSCLESCTLIYETLTWLIICRSATFWQCTVVASLFTMLFAQALIATNIRTGTLLASTSSLSGSSNKAGLRSCTLEQAAVKTETVCQRKHRSNGTSKTAFVPSLAGVKLVSVGVRYKSGNPASVHSYCNQRFIIVPLTTTCRLDF